MRQILLVLIVLALGCGGMVATPGSELPAVVIKEYNFDQNTIRQGQTTGINLVIQNLGDEKAREIKTKLFRTGEGITVAEPKVQTAGSLNPPDQNTQTPGESKEFTWQITATTPKDTKTTKSYNIGVLVGYKYKSEGFSDLLATTKEQAKIDKNQLPALRSGSTKGPISVNVITPNSILYKDEEKVTVRVDVVNGANGIVYAGRNGADQVVGDSSEMNKIQSLEIQIPKDYTKAFDSTVGSDLGGGAWCCNPECDKMDRPEKADYVWISGETSDHKYRTLKKTYSDVTPIPEEYYKKSLELLRGKQKSYVCYFKIDRNTVGEQQVIPIRAIAEYSYSTEDSKILVVEGAK